MLNNIKKGILKFYQNNCNKQNNNIADYCHWQVYKKFVKFLNFYKNNKNVIDYIFGYHENITFKKYDQQ